MLDRLLVFIDKALCWLGHHTMEQTQPRLRVCSCGYREYLFFRGYSFGRWVERWYPYKGPCTIDVDGFTYSFDADKKE